MKKITKLSILFISANFLLTTTVCAEPEKGALKRSSSLSDLSVRSGEQTWNPIPYPEYIAKEKENTGKESRVEASRNSVTPLLVELMQTFGAKEYPNSNGKVFSVDLSFPNLINVAKKRLVDTEEEAFPLDFPGQTLSYGNLKYLFGENSPIRIAIQTLRENNPSEEKFRSVLNSEQIFHLTNLMTGDSPDKLFNIRGLKDEDKDRFKAIVREHLLPNSIGCQLLLSLLIVGVLNTGEQSFDLPATEALKSARARGEEYLPKNPFSISICSTSRRVDTACYNPNSNSAVVHLSRAGCDRTVFHELTHAYEEMIKLNFSYPVSVNFFSCSSTKEIPFMNYSIMNSGIPYLVKVFFPMIEKSGLDQQHCQPNQEINELQKNNLRSHFYAKGFGNAYFQDLNPEAIDRLALADSPILWQSPYEVLTMLGIVPFKYGERIYMLELRQNERIYLGRKAARDEENASVVFQGSGSGLRRCRFHVEDSDEFEPWIKELEDGNYPFYQEFDGSDYRTKDQDIADIQQHTDFIMANSH